MGRIKQLTDMEIDEISLVDRPANAHARVVISKRAGEEDMPEDIYDENGELLDEIEVGDVVYDADGDPFLVVDGEYEDFADDSEETLEEVGKHYDEEISKVNAKVAMGPGKIGGVSGSPRAAAGPPNPVKDPNKVNNTVTTPTPRNGNPTPGTGAANKTDNAAKTSDELGHWEKHKNKYMIGSGVVGAGALGYGASQMSKSFSDELREELSKSLTDIERDEVISKAFHQVEEMAESLAEAQEIAKSERDLRLLAEYEEVAKSYNVPVDPAELAPVLYTIAEVLPYEYGEVIHKALSAAGEMIFEEVGFEGSASNNDVLFAVDQFIEENVEKSDISKAEAVSAVFDANPDAYDQYMATRYL